MVFFSPLNWQKSENWFALLSREQHQVIGQYLYLQDRAGDTFFPIASPGLADHAQFFGVPQIAVDAWAPSIQRPALCTVQVDLLFARSQDAVLMQRSHSVLHLVPVAMPPVDKYNLPEKYYKCEEEIAAFVPREENPLVFVAPFGLGMRVEDQRSP